MDNWEDLLVKLAAWWADLVQQAGAIPPDSPVELPGSNVTGATLDLFCELFEDHMALTVVERATLQYMALSLHNNMARGVQAASFRMVAPPEVNRSAMAHIVMLLAFAMGAKLITPHLPPITAVELEALNLMRKKLADPGRPDMLFNGPVH